MTDGEIRASYRQAKYPNQQIKILSQLTNKSIADIKIICGVMSAEETHVPKKRNQHIAWTQNEVKKLIKAHKYGYAQKRIAKLLDRSVSSVQTKFYELKRKGLI